MLILSSIEPCRISKAPPRIKSKLFYTLGRGTRYIRPDVRSYWHHLTLESYHVYENIYHDCKSSDGKVECKSSQSPLHNPHPPPHKKQKAKSKKESEAAR